MKKLYILKGEIKTPPLSHEARREIGHLLRIVQVGDSLSLPHSRPMPSIGKGCHELRVNDKNGTWRVIYYIDHEHDAVVVLDSFAKKTNKTPKNIINTCQTRLASYKQSRRN